MFFPILCATSMLSRRGFDRIGISSMHSCQECFPPVSCHHYSAKIQSEIRIVCWWSRHISSAMDRSFDNGNDVTEQGRALIYKKRQNGADVWEVTGGSRGQSGHAPNPTMAPIQSDSLVIKLLKLVPPDVRF